MQEMQTFLGLSEYAVLTLLIKISFMIIVPMVASTIVFFGLRFMRIKRRKVFHDASNNFKLGFIIAYMFCITILVGFASLQ